MAKFARAKQRNRSISRQAIEPLERRVLLSTVVVNTTIDGVFPPSTGLVSLRSAIATANGSSTPTTITFDPKVFATQQTIALNGSALDLTNSPATTITGPSSGVVINAGGHSRVFTIEPGKTASLTGMTITGGQGDNFRVYTGGGIYNAGNLTLTDVTVTGNASLGDGGGIESSYIGQSSITLVNVTISGNSAGPADGNGGGGLRADGQAYLYNVTISGNTSPAGAGGVSFGQGTCTIVNTIVAGNHITGGSGPDVSGGFNSLGYNLIGITDGSTGFNASDLTGTAAKPLDPKLSPLGNYGGPAQTMALLPGSPAINAGWNALAVDGNGNRLATDQRGFPRIYGPAVDIGAYEAQPPELAGDVNHDGTVNLADLLILTRDFGKSTAVGEGGDLNGDGTVNLADFLILTRNFAKSATPAASASSAAGQTATTTPGKSPARVSVRRTTLAACLAG